MTKEEIRKARKEFDVAMSREFGERKVLGRFDIEKAMKMAYFTWRRLAFWLNATRKQVWRECQDLISNNGVLGIGKAKISRKIHFV